MTEPEKIVPKPQTHLSVFFSLVLMILPLYCLLILFHLRSSQIWPFWLPKTALFLLFCAIYFGKLYHMVTIGQRRRGSLAAMRFKGQKSAFASELLDMDKVG